MANSKKKSGYLESKLFQTAVTEAKAVARTLKHKELSIQHLLIGLARTPSGWDEVSAELRSKLLVLIDLSRFSALSGSGPADKNDDAKMPLTEGLRRVLAAPDLTVQEVIHDLVGHAKSQSGGGFEVLPTIAELADRIASRLGNSKIDDSVFCMAAFIAFQEGRLFGSPEICAVLITHREALVGLLDRFSVEVGGLVSNAPHLPYSEKLSACLLDGSVDSFPLLGALNSGLREAVETQRLKRTAYHEAGHAVASSVLRPNLPVVKITVVAKGDADGTTYYDPNSPYWGAITEADIGIALAVALAGRAAEQIRFGLDQADSGASSDLEQATKRCWQAIAHWGLDEEFGPIALNALSEMDGFQAGLLQGEAQRRLRTIMKAADKQAKDVLLANWRQVQAVAERLLSDGNLDYRAFIETMTLRSLSDLPSAVRVRVKPSDRTVRFATGSGVLETREGPVRFLEGDALVSDPNVGSWPVERAVFERSYSPVGSLVMGEDGLYRTRSIQRLAMRVAAQSQIYLSQGRGIHLAQNEDWIVDYGDGDLAIVSDEAFRQGYERD